MALHLTYNTNAAGSNDDSISISTCHRCSTEITSYWVRTQRRVARVSIHISHRWREPSSWSTGLSVRIIPSVVTAVFNSSRVDCPEGDSSSIHYTSECDIISRTYPTRWSSELTQCSWNCSKWQSSQRTCTHTLPKNKAKTENPDNQSEILILKSLRCV